MAALAVLLSACGSMPGAAACVAPFGQPAARTIVNGDCQTSLTSERQAYSQGQAVVFTLTTTSTGSGCGIGLPCDGLDVEVADAGGNLIWRTPHPMIACPALARLLRPGESVSSSATWAHPSLPPGRYWASSAGASTEFSVC